MTFIAALRHDRISAPWVIDGPINGELFTLYVEKVLAPTLAPGEVVVEATWRKVGELLDLFSNEECANYLKNSGYVSV